MSASHRPLLPSLSGRLVAVTGANRGIGLALTKALLAAGAHVVAGCRQPQAANDLSALAKAHPDALTILALDITDAPSVTAFAKQVKRPIDLLINNAGVNLDAGESPLALAPSKLMDTFAINTVGPLRVLQALRPHLAEPHALVINISSIMGSIAENEMGGNTAYRVSKTALNMLNKNLAVADTKVTYLVMHPGWVQTRMGGSKAPVQDQDSAAGILSVACQATAKDSGRFIRFDGQKAPW